MEKTTAAQNVWLGFIHTKIKREITGWIRITPINVSHFIPDSAPNVISASINHSITKLLFPYIPFKVKLSDMQFSLVPGRGGVQNAG